MWKTRYTILALVRDSFICIFCVTLAVDLSHAYSLEDVADPPQSKLTYVGNVVHNGLPMEILQFTSHYSVSELLAYYKQRWSDVTNRNDNVPSYIEKHISGWSILSKLEGSKNVVVQIKEVSNGTVEGFISVSDLAQPKTPELWVNEFPRMHGTELVSNTESKVKGRRAYTLILVNENSITENSDFYRSNMDTYGWRLSRSGVKDNVSMLHFLKDEWYCDLTLSETDDGKSVIVANLVELNGD